MVLEDFDWFWVILMYIDIELIQFPLHNLGSMEIRRKFKRGYYSIKNPSPNSRFFVSWTVIL